MLTGNSYTFQKVKYTITTCLEVIVYLIFDPHTLYDFLELNIYSLHRLAAFNPYMSESDEDSGKRICMHAKHYMCMLKSSSLSYIEKLWLDKYLERLVYN